MDAIEHAYLEASDAAAWAYHVEVDHEHMEARFRAYRRGVLAAGVDPATLSIEDVHEFDESIEIEDEHVHCRRVQSPPCVRDLDAVAAEVERQLQQRRE